MSRSLATGWYRLVMAVESASRADHWYRICADTQSGALSCICPKWLYPPSGTTQRGCKHTEVVQRLTSPAHASQPGSMSGATQGGALHPLVRATQQQWPGLVGQWSIEERNGRIGNDDYHVVLLRLVTNAGYTASGVAAFAQRHHPTHRSMIPSVAGWIGYAIAAEIARQAGFPLAGQPPEDYRARQGRRTARRGPATAAPSGVALRDILRVGDTVELGDGLQPVQRAEHTLRLFLGELYTQLERQGYLDVSSNLYAADQRVYRLRRDPAKGGERRVRVFEHGQYTKDFCIVRASDVPEADHYLTVFLRLISDEAGVLQVVKQHNTFPPYSDSRVRETVPAMWQAAAA